MRSSPASLGAVLLLAGMTLRQRRASLLIFAGAACLFQLVVVVSYPAIGGAAAVDSVVAQLSPALRRVLKLVPNLQGGLGLREYLAFSLYHPVFLALGSGFVVSRAAEGLAGDLERGAIYLLLSRPVPRWALVLGRGLELIAGAGVVALLGWLGLALGALVTPLPASIPLDRYLLTALVAWLLFAALGAVALAISAAGRRLPAVTAIGTAWTLIAFILDVLPATGDGPLAPLNPWRQYDPPSIAATGTIGPLVVPVLLAWTVGGLLAAAAIFQRRDLA